MLQCKYEAMSLLTEQKLLYLISFLDFRSLKAYSNPGIIESDLESDMIYTILFQSRYHYN
jgi:hypothetical protein